MSVIVPGLGGTNFTIDPNVSLMQLLQNSWSAGGANNDPDLQIYDSQENPTGVKIGTSWYDESTYYQIHVRPFTRLSPRATIGSKPRMNFQDKRQIHVFAKGNAYGSGKQKAWEMESEIERILWVFNSQPFGGILFMNVDSWTPVWEPDPKATVFHSLALITLMYQKQVI
jgi:hypothetical protein